MATSKTNTAANATVGSKSSTANAAEQPVKTQRVLETRDQWAVIFNHTVSLVVALTKGEELPDDPRKGFAFGPTKEQPHSRKYAHELLAGFTSKKAGKVLAQTVGLQTDEERTKIALRILLKTKLGGKDEAEAKRLLSKAEKKQARAFATAVLNFVQASPKSDAVAPKEQAKTPAKPKRKGK